MENDVENTTTSQRPLFLRGLEKFSWLKNKYLLSALFFVVWMFWFDPKDFRTEMNRRAKYKALKESEQHLTNLISQTQNELDELKTNAQTIERYAREKYYMKKDNEDIFVVPENNQKK
jgi:cell division protein DivIC